MQTSLHPETAVILAGGRSSRMGTDKALLPIAGRPMIQHLASLLNSMFLRLLIVAGDPENYSFTSCEVIADTYTARGPLGGLHAALARMETECCFVTSCDTPFINVGLVKYIITQRGRADACVPVSDGRLHPLCAVYHSRTLPVIERQLSAGHNRLQDLLKLLHVRIVEISADNDFYTEQLLMNVNTLEEYRKIPRYSGL